MDNMKTKEEIASELRDIQRRLFMIRLSLQTHHASIAYGPSSMHQENAIGNFRSLKRQV